MGTCLITGANSGIGKASAIQIAGKGYRVVIACRNRGRREAALQKIKEQSGRGSVELMIVDMSSQGSGRELVKRYTNSYEVLDVLIQNAAIFDVTEKEKVFTEEGIESIWATNHLGPVLLTERLLDSLDRSSQGRTLTVASKGLAAALLPMNKEYLCYKEDKLVKTIRYAYVCDMDIGRDLLAELFSALGAHLERAGLPITIVVVGGASLAAQGLVERTTKDVDVIARAEVEDGRIRLERATPFPDEFIAAVERVARDFGLATNWLNAVIDKQWEAGLPPNIEDDVSWRTYAALTVGYVGRRGLIPLKFFAAIDQGPASKHWQDLLSLRPTEQEIREAANWVRDQDIGTEFKTFVNQASEQLRRDLGIR